MVESDIGQKTVMGGETQSTWRLHFEPLVVQGKQKGTRSTSGFREGYPIKTVLAVGDWKVICSWVGPTGKLLAAHEQQKQIV